MASSQVFTDRDLTSHARLAQPTADMSRLAEADCIIICVPTPLTDGRDPDLTYIEGTARSVAQTLRPGQLVVLESTTHPTTTRVNVWPILEATGLTCGTDYFLAFSPEREDPGNPQFQAATIPKVVGGFDEGSADLACAMYGHAVVEVVRVSGLEVAEASTCGKSSMRPGPSHSASRPSTQAQDWEGTASPSIPSTSRGWLASTGSRHGSSSLPARSTRTCRGTWSTGLASSSTIRASREPVIRADDVAVRARCRAELQRSAHSRAPRMRHYPELPSMKSQELTPAYLSAQDCVLIATDHSAYDYDFILEHSTFVLDTRNATKNVTRGREKIRRA